MSKPAANPFFEIDFSKFADMSKMASEFKMPFSMEPMMAMQRRNVEAMTAVNQAAYESMQMIARRNMDMMRQGMEDMMGMMNSMMTMPSASPQEKVMRQAEVSKMAVEKCITNAKEVADTLNKCNTQAMEIVANRLSESMEEIRGMMQPKQQNAA